MYPVTSLPDAGRVRIRPLDRTSFPRLKAPVADYQGGLRRRRAVREFERALANAPYSVRQELLQMAERQNFHR